MSRCGCFKLNVLSVGFSIGIASGIFLMALAWSAWKWGYGVFMVQQKAAIFPGFEASFNGGLYGLAWGILVGFIFGLIFSIVYNLCLCCKPCHCCCCKSLPRG